MPFIIVRDGTQIYYKDWGAGQPVVFSHGWPLSADAWDAQMLFLASHGFRAINQGAGGFVLDSLIAVLAWAGPAEPGDCEMLRWARGCARTAAFPAALLLRASHPRRDPAVRCGHLLNLSPAEVDATAARAAAVHSAFRQPLLPVTSAETGVAKPA